MIQLNVLSGKRAGSQPVVRRFPFHVGRATGNDLQLDDAGVWDRHLALECQRSEGFKLVTAPDALSAVNDQPVQNARLRNGDIITVGSVKLQFWLAAVRQRGLRLRERFVWALLLLVTLGQFVLIYWLLW
jgi:pSer/pThr/pTyr-binding forkhead associated (FHA) protein